MEVNELDKPLISIVMPAYNSEKYIAKSIESVFNQTYKNWELIIIDDCSVDSTQTIIEEYSMSNEKVIVITNSENKGVSESRNKGIQRATGSWIAFLDSDDLWREDKLAKQVDQIIKTGERFFYTGSVYIDSQGNPLKGYQNIPEKVNYKELLKCNIIPCSSVLIDKKLLLLFEMKVDALHEDYLVWLRILKSGVTAISLNEPLLIYRISINSKSGNKMKSVIMTYRVYREIGMSIIKSCYYMIGYVYLKIRKYRHIKRL